MSDTPPVLGQDPWGADLNTYLASLEAKITALTGRVTSAESRLTAVEAKPEYIYNSFAWQFNNGAPPATGSQVRLNNVNAPLATLIDIRFIDSDGADRTPTILALSVGSQVRINDWNNAANLHRWRVTGAVTTNATNAQIPVVWMSGSGVIPNAKANVAFLVVLTP